MHTTSLVLNRINAPIFLDIGSSRAAVSGHSCQAERRYYVIVWQGSVYDRVQRKGSSRRADMSAHALGKLNARSEGWLTNLLRTDRPYTRHGFGRGEPRRWRRVLIARTGKKRNLKRERYPSV